jgi:hypothetical protein
MFDHHQAHPGRYRIAASAVLVVGLTVVGAACQDHSNQGVTHSTGLPAAVVVTAPVRPVSPVLTPSASVPAYAPAPALPSRDDTSYYGGVMDNQLGQFNQQTFGHP